MSADLNPATGIVTLRATLDGLPWRRSIMPHAVAELDAFAPSLPPEQRAAILADWDARPVATGDVE